MLCRFRVLILAPEHRSMLNVLCKTAWKKGARAAVPRSIKPYVTFTSTKVLKQLQCSFNINPVNLLVCVRACACVCVCLRECVCLTVTATILLLTALCWNLSNVLQPSSPPPCYSWFHSPISQLTTRWLEWWFISSGMAATCIFISCSMTSTSVQNPLTWKIGTQHADCPSPLLTFLYFISYETCCSTQ